jgi:hypothetical protein
MPREEGVEADLGIQSRDDGEGDGLGNEGEGDDESRQNIATNVGKGSVASTCQANKHATACA